MDTKDASIKRVATEPDDRIQHDISNHEEPSRSNSTPEENINSVQHDSNMPT